MTYNNELLATSVAFDALQDLVAECNHKTLTTILGILPRTPEETFESVKFLIPAATYDAVRTALGLPGEFDQPANEELTDEALESADGVLTDDVDESDARGIIFFNDPLPFSHGNLGTLLKLSSDVQDERIEGLTLAFMAAFEDAANNGGLFDGAIIAFDDHTNGSSTFLNVHDVGPVTKALEEALNEELLKHGYLVELSSESDGFHPYRGWRHTFHAYLADCNVNAADLNPNGVGVIILTD